MVGAKNERHRIEKVYGRFRRVLKHNGREVLDASRSGVQTRGVRMTVRLRYPSTMTVCRLPLRPTTQTLCSALTRSLVLCSFVLLPPSAHPCKAQEATACCSSEKGVYRCDLAGLQRTVASAHTFAVQAGPRDRIATSQLQSLGVSLGKSLALANQPADLAFALLSTEEGGVNYGAMDRELARLQVYSSDSATGSRTLVWVETLSGPADLSWPAVVHRVIEQFRSRLKK